MKSKTKIINCILTLILIVLSNNTLYAQKYVVKDGSAFFKAETSVSSYTGISNQLQGYIDFQSSIIEFKLPSKSIKTGNKKRDQHMYELLKIDENINVIFRGKLIDEFDIDKIEKQTLKVKGEFTLAGSTKEIEIKIDLTTEQNGLHLQASWYLLITEYNLKRPSKAFFKVKDEHQLNVDTMLVKE
jgi:polyisoprenoid-binding protein YceI